jgi:pyruvate formate-lyase activating enzyme-like uncharacterized protein
MRFLTVALLVALPGLCAAETWENVSVVDVSCSAKVKADADAHTRACAMKCEKSGYAIVTSDGTVLKFDAKGNEEAIAALKASSKVDHLRVTVMGDRDGDTIKVKSLRM